MLIFNIYPTKVNDPWCLLSVIGLKIMLKLFENFIQRLVMQISTYPEIYIMQMRSK